MTEPTFRIEVDDVGSFNCLKGENALKAMEKANLKLIPVGCRGGGCGVCKARVIKGRYLTRPMSAIRISPTERATGHVLCCRLMPLSDLTIITKR
nr:2Fe-2S iron-sulfur cluster-binding protein [Sphingomonas sp. CDS-1]